MSYLLIDCEFLHQMLSSNMVLHYVVLANLFVFSSAAIQNYIEYPHTPCRPGDVAENDCNLCICNKKYVYECYERQCKVPIRKAVDEQAETCQPRVVYVRQDVICICSKAGRWPHSKCEAALQNLLVTGKTSALNEAAPLKLCEPHSYVKVECNVCRCSAKGEVDSKYCTKNKCTQIYTKNARKTQPLPRSVHGHCEPKNWYSIAPCQFCFCVNTNKLVCNTEDFYVNKLQLGKYNLNVCGKDLIKDAIELIPSDTNLRFDGDAKTSPPPTPPVVQKLQQKSHGINNLPMVVKEVITHKNNNDPEGSTEYEDMDDGRLNSAKSALSISEGKPMNARGNNIETKKTDDYEEEDDDVGASPSKYANVKKTNTKHAINVDKIIINVDKSNKNSSVPKAAREGNPEDNYVLDVFVPNVLESLFHMQMRKSMLKVIPNTDCFPGTKETVDCNTCYCLNNGKKLCTNTVCK